jgi:hypothetical protein
LGRTVTNGARARTAQNVAFVKLNGAQDIKYRGNNEKTHPIGDIESTLRTTLVSFD